MNETHTSTHTHNHPHSAAALLSIRKFPSSGMLGPRLPDPQLYVVRNKRKRLAITPVEVRVHMFMLRVFREL
jgi:hypothetical protein